MLQMDDNYTLQRAETSTIDYEYLKSHSKVGNWFEGMSTVEEEHGSIHSPSLTNERMLDYVVNGPGTNQYSTDTKPMNDTGFYTSTENYCTTAMTKNDTEYYSGSSESLTNKNGSYISEKATFCDTAKKTTLLPVQEEFRLDNVVKEEELVQSKPSQITPIPNGYVTLEDQNLSYTQNATECESNHNKQREYTLNSTSSSNHSSSPTEYPVEETNKNNENGNSPALSEGEYLPYTTAISQPADSSSVTVLLQNHHHMQQNHITGVSNDSSVESMKQGAPVGENFPYVMSNKDNTFGTPPSTHALTGKKTTINVTGYEASGMDIMPHSESCSQVFPDMTTTAYWDKCVDHNINAHQQSTQYETSEDNV